MAVQQSCLAIVSVWHLHLHQLEIVDVSVWKEEVVNLVVISAPLLVSMGIAQSACWSLHLLEQQLALAVCHSESGR